MLTAAISFLIVLIGILAVPIVMTFRLSWPNYAENDVRLVWAFGLVSVRLAADRLEAPSEGRASEAERSDGKDESIKGGARFMTLVRNKKLRRRVVRFARDFWRAFDKEDLCLHARIGLDDPAETGRLWAVIGPLSGALSGSRHVSIGIEPDFLEPRFDATGSGTVRLIPLQVLHLLIALFLSPSLWHGIRQMRLSA